MNGAFSGTAADDQYCSAGAHCRPATAGPKQSEQSEQLKVAVSVAVNRSSGRSRQPQPQKPSRGCNELRQHKLQAGRGKDCSQTNSKEGLNETEVAVGLKFAAVAAAAAKSAEQQWPARMVCGFVAVTVVHLISPHLSHCFH